MNEVERFAASPVARMATVDDGGAPHLVPVVFVATADTVHTPVDHKPKTTVRLKRLANISAEPRVSLLVDHYDDDWTRLWWVRADGRATVLESGAPGHAAAADALAAKYADYQKHPIAGPIIEVRVERWSSWQAAGP